MTYYFQRSNNTTDADFSKMKWWHPEDNGIASVSAGENTCQPGVIFLTKMSYKNEKCKKIYFTIASKNIRFLELNLKKYVQDFNTE